MSRNVTIRPAIAQQLVARTNLHQVTSSRGTLHSIVATNLGADQWLQIWDATGTGDASARQLNCVQLPNNKTVGIDSPFEAIRGILLRVSTVAESSVADLNGNVNLGTADVRFTTRHG